MDPQQPTQTPPVDQPQVPAQPVQATPPTQTPQPIQPPARPAFEAEKEKKLPLIGVVFILLALVLGGVFAANYFGLLKFNKTQPTATIASTPTATPDETANWKTYTGESFSFKYPPYLNEKPYAEGSFGGIFLVSADDYEAKVQKNIMIKTLYVPDQNAQTYAEEMREKDGPDADPSSITEIIKLSIGEKEAYQYEVSFMGRALVTIIPVNKTDVLRMVGYFPFGDKNTESDRELLNQILSTFKLTESESEKILYKNIDLGFSLEIPTSWKGRYSVTSLVKDGASSADFTYVGSKETVTYPMFTIYKVSAERWLELTKQTGPGDVSQNKLTSESGYVYFYTQSIDNPLTGEDGNNLQTMSADIQNILTSFKTVSQ